MFYSLLRLDEGSATDGDEGPALDTVLGAPLVSAYTHTNTHRVKTPSFRIFVFLCRFVLTKKII